MAIANDAGNDRLRHEDRIAKMLAEALDRMTPAPQDAGRESIRTVQDLIEKMGAYRLADDLMRGFGRYRLADCSPEQLLAIIGALKNATCAPCGRMHKPLDAQSAAVSSGSRAPATAPTRPEPQRPRHLAPVVSINSRDTRECEQVLSELLALARAGRITGLNWSAVTGGREIMSGCAGVMQRNEGLALLSAFRKAVDIVDGQLNGGGPA